jgi:hypothetical protein
LTQELPDSSLELQSALDRIQNEIFDFNVPPEHRLLIKVRHEKGSSDLTAEIGSLLKKMVGNLTTKQKTLLISLSILAVAGYFTTSKILDYKAAVAESAADELTKAKLIEVIDRQHTRLEESERPVRTLVHAMDAADTIKLPAFKDALTKDEAKKLYPRKARTAAKTDYVDGKYVIREISYDDPVTVTVEKDGVVFKAGLLLAATQLDGFYSEIKKLQLTPGSEVELELQITARYSGTGIREASIVGVGTPRDSSVTIASVMPK